MMLAGWLQLMTTSTLEGSTEFPHQNPRDPGKKSDATIYSAWRRVSVDEGSPTLE